MNEGERELLKMFLADVKKCPVLSKEDECLIAKQAQMGDEEAFEHLVGSNLRFTLKIAFRYSRLRYPLMDLISAGYLGLIVAIKTYDPDKGFRFITYAGYSIEQRILQFIKDYEHHNLLSLDEPILEEGDETTFKDILVSNSPASDDRYFDYQIRDLLDNLNERERKVIEARFWGDKTLGEVSLLIGTCRARVGQIEARALRKLRWIIHKGAGKGEWRAEQFDHLYQRQSEFAR